MHTPVLLEPAIKALNLSNNKIIVDGTLGLGGHSIKILEHIIPDGTLIGIDQDIKNLKIAEKNLFSYCKNTKIVHDNFVNIKSILANLNIKQVDGILLDIGMASTHIDDNERGFSFKNDGPLDMRMNTDQELTAYTVINTYSEEDLANIIYQYGEERQSYKIAKMIVNYRKIKKFQTTQEFATEIARVIKTKIKNKYQNKHPALLTFQAIRIEVNQELAVLKKVIQDSVELLSHGGRLVVISYHSLEDRIVKNFLRDQTRQCICPKEVLLCTCKHVPLIKIITKKPIVPTDTEIQNNHRSRSAKMRVAEKI